jgi:hypothetical protein
MRPNTGSYGGDAVEERRVQRVLNEKVGDRLPERSWWHRRRWRLRTDKNTGRPPADA